MSTQPRIQCGLEAALAGKTKKDARRRKRIPAALPIHVRPFDPRFRDKDDVGVVLDFTRDGLYFTTCMPHYFVGMRLEVTFPYGDKVAAHRTSLGLIVRIKDCGNGKHGIGLRFLLR
jgi:hypothetical protein